MTQVEIGYDTDRWVLVPLDYADTQWENAQEWADWLATAATTGRDDAQTVAPLVYSSALEVALFPAAHVWKRFWHYPIDGVPTGFVDVYVQQRVDDGASAEDLLPETGFTAVTPNVERLDVPGYASAVRRHSLVLVLRSEDDEQPAVMPRIEWLGVTTEWVSYLVTNDHDPAAANERAADVEALFEAISSASPDEADRRPDVVA